MEDQEDKPKSNIHIHIGGIIFILIIIFVLFRVDIKSSINSPRFQANLNYIEQKGKNVWLTYLEGPLLSLWHTMFNNLVDQGAKELKGNAPDINKFNLGGYQGQNTSGGGLEDIKP